MKTNQNAHKGPLLAILAPLTLVGCSHIPNGGASSVKASFGVPSVFHVTKEADGIVVTKDQIKAASSSTKVSILLFTWDSSAKDIVLPNPKAKP